MTKHQQVLLELLCNLKPLAAETLSGLTAPELAQLYVDAAFLGSALKFLKEEHWLQKKNNPTFSDIYFDFLAEIFKTELRPLSYLKSYFEDSKLSHVPAISAQALAVETLSMAIICSRSKPEQIQFARQALSGMRDLFIFENRLQLQKKSEGLHLGLSLYRTFDRLDELFDLDYDADLGMKTDLQGKERLYEGAGVGVQSGYSTVLLALEGLNPSKGARFIDLGSGYGRVGLIVGLLRPDLDFTGYEYVPHRVGIARNSSENFGLQEHVHFHTQDLSLEDFKIPDADIYYLYDPFSEQTYRFVLSQLRAISRRHQIVIITKGNARGWLKDFATQEGWKPPIEFDSGNLCLFYSA